MKTKCLLFLIIFSTITGCSQTIKLHYDKESGTTLHSIRRPSVKVFIDKDFKYFGHNQTTKDNFIKTNYIFIKSSEDGNKIAEGIRVSLWYSDKVYKKWRPKNYECNQTGQLMVGKDVYDICATYVMKKTDFNWGQSFDCDIQFGISNVQGLRNNNFILINYFKDIDGIDLKEAELNTWYKILQTELGLLLSKDFKPFKILE